MTPPTNLKGRVEAKAEALAKSPTGDKVVTSPVLPCDATPIRAWHHIGLDTSIQQYRVGTRTSGLEMPVLDNTSVKDMEALHNSKPGAFPAAKKDDPSLLKLHPPEKGVGFRATPTMGVNSLREESGSKENTFHIDTKGCMNLNPHLGRALAIHFSRSGVYSPYPTESGLIFLRNPEDGLLKTEMLGARVFLYLRMALDKDSEPQIREVIQGKLQDAVIPKADYDNRKFIIKSEHESAQASTKHGGDMQLIPGVYQIHVLFTGAGGEFSVVEVHCDGDPLPIA